MQTVAKQINSNSKSKFPSVRYLQ
uniref:Uncharacterized protein n=1 Tax=Anguilla anguilla TaxID=7936 RepID=A0A0E9TEP4_ANGAN